MQKYFKKYSPHPRLNFLPELSLSYIYRMYLYLNPHVWGNIISIFGPCNLQWLVTSTDHTGHNNSVALFLSWKSKGVNHRGLCKQNFV